MKYHLNRDGQNLGLFSLEELQQRYAAGEFNGTELVWTQGMANWEPLGSVLSPSLNPAFAQGTPMTKRQNFKFFPVYFWAGLAIVLLFVFVWALGNGIIEPFFKSLSVRPDSATAQVSAMDAACEPVVVSSNSLTEEDVEKINREFRIRQYLDGYKLRGERNPECDALALGMISNWIACNFGGVVDTNLPPLPVMADQLAEDTNCTDPLVLTVAGVNAVELHEAIRRLERAVKGFQNSRHLCYPKCYAVEMLVGRMIYDKDDRMPVLDAQALEYFHDAFTDGSFQPGDQPLIAEIFVSGWGSPFFNRNSASVCAMVQRLGKPYQWLALVLQGETEINEAWLSRGGGYANTVSDSGWQGFNQHLARARQCLTQAWELNTNWALAPDRMIYVSLGDSNIGEMRKWFDRTVAAQIDYADAWNQMRWGLRPRWYGSLDAMLAFGATALNTRRFDTDVPRKFFDSLSDVESEMNLPQGQHIYEREDVWPNLKTMYEGYIAVPDQTDWARDGWRGAYAAVSYLAGKYQVSRGQLEKLNWQPHPFNLTGWGRDLSGFPLEVAARTGSQSNQVDEAEQDCTSGDAGGALKILGELASAANVDAMTRSYARERQYSLSLEQDLAAGKWVSFLPSDPAFTGWQTNFGDFKMLADGSLEVHSDESGHMIYCRTPIGMEFEAKGEFDIISSTTKAFQAGMVMGLPQTIDTQTWDAFRIKRNSDEGDVASFSQNWIKHQILAPIRDLNSRSNSFYLRLHDGLVTASVNGQTLFENTAPARNYYLVTNRFLVGLGAFNDSDATVIRYRDVEIRRLQAN